MSVTVVAPVFQSNEDPTRRKSYVYADFEYDFQNFSQYAISSLCYCLTPTAFIYFDQSEKDNAPLTVILFTGVFFCLPIYYMELFLGKYTQNGVFHLKYMVPIAKGLPFVHLLVTILYTVGTGYYMADALLYMLMCFQRDLPWTVCPENITEDCYYQHKPSDCRICMHSSMAYWKYIYMENPALTYQQLRLGLPILHRFVSSCVCWVVVFLVTVIAYRQRHKCLSILFYLYCVILAFLFIIVLLSLGGTTDLARIFTIVSPSYLNARSWAEALVKGVKLLKMGHAHHVLAGARLPKKASVGLWCVSFWAIITVLSMFSSLFEMAIRGVHKHHTGSNPEDVHHTHQLFVVIIPGGLSYTGAAHVWSALFFFSMLTILTANIVTRIINLQLNITDYKPSLQKFKVYLLVGYCLTFAFIATLLLSENHYILTRLLLEGTATCLEIIAVTLLIIVVFWIYGIQTVSDDILFYTNNKPIRFWVVSWYVSPIVFILLIVHVMARFLEVQAYLVIYISTAILLAPFVICAIHAIFVYVKKRRLLGLIEPELEWGVPDPDERHMRRIFNPRSETKFERKRTVCSHKCIQNSPYLRSVLNCETLNRFSALSSEEMKQLDLRSDASEFEGEDILNIP